MVLAKNVIQYYDLVLKGLQYIENGEVFIDIPDELRIRNMNSLKEKSQAILQVLTEYDTELSRTLAEGDENASNPQQFFENIAKMWINMKDKILEASTQFPISAMESRKEIDRQKQETARIIQEKIVKNELEVQERLQDIASNQQLNNLTKQEWDLFNQYFSINLGSALKTGTSVIDNVVNATSDVGNNLVENVGKLGERGISSLISMAWGLAKLGMILSIPALIYISLKTGLITSIFANIQKSLTKSISAPTNQPTTTQPTTTQPETTPTNQPSPLQNTNIDVNPKIDEKEEIDELANILLNMKMSPVGGRRNNRKIPNRKTRKHKKRKTRKLRGGKRRRTRHKKTRPTKKH
jgi:hypothetical protein